MAAAETNSLESMVLPTIAFIIGAIASILSIFFALKGWYIWLLPSGFAVFVFGALGFVTWYVRKRVRQFVNERERVRHGGN